MEAFRNRIVDMMKLKTSELAQLAVRIEKPEVIPLIDSANKLSLSQQNELKEYQKIEPQ